MNKAWVSVRESLPECRGYYLAVIERTAPEELGGNSTNVKIMRWMGEDWRYARHIPEWINEKITDTVTHWMFLPEPPEEKHWRSWRIRMKPLYEPKGKAKEYGDLAINIYTGCPHGCYYCFAPNVLHKNRESFHNHVEPRKGIVEAVKKQLSKEQITGKLIHLCFTCDPYPMGYDTTPTREVIKAIKETGNHVQILTKNSSTRDLDLLDENDWYGITLTGATKGQEPCYSQLDRLWGLAVARSRGIKTWVSFEPVINAEWVLSCIAAHGEIFDKIKIGKLNYHPSDIDWAEFGKRVESLCVERGFNYYIKESLRKVMGDKV